MDTWMQISGLKDGTPLDETTINTPTYQLKARTDYLKARIDALIDAGNLASVKYADVLLATGTDAPVVGDVVTLDPSTGRYVKALYGADPVTGDVATGAHAVGVLVDSRNGRGVVTAVGIASTFDVAGMLEPGEIFSAGVYHLSHRVPGKITARYAQGAPPVCVLLDLDANDAPQAAFVNVQHKDPGADHRHNGVRLQPQVAGTLVEEGGGHTLLGFDPLSTQSLAHGAHVDPTGVPSVLSGATLVDTLYDFSLGNYIGLTVCRVVADAITDVAVITNHNSVSVVMDPVINFNVGEDWIILPRTRIRVTGTYSGGGATYALALTDSTGVLALGANQPDSDSYFKDVWLKWTSSDPDEGTGLERVRGYEVPVPFGTHGCVAALENALEDTADEQWDWPEQAAEYIDRRAWTIAAPDDTAGWMKRRVIELLDGGDGPALSLFGDLPSGGAGISASAGTVATIAYTVNPSDGDTVRIGAVTYRFVDTLESPESGLTDILIGASAAESYLALAAAARVNNVVAGSTGTSLLVAGQASVTTDMTVATTVVWTSGGTDVSTAAFLVVDDDGNALVASGSGLWVPGAYCSPATLTNGLRLQVLAYTFAGAAAGAISTTQVYRVELGDESPGAIYVYNVGMDTSLGRVYPPTPITAAALVRNGAEFNNAAVHPDDAHWRAGLSGVYWYSEAGQVPFNDDAADADVTLYTTTSKSPESGVVTSLQPAAGSPVRLYRCGSKTPATSGDLEVDAKLQLATQDNNELADFYAVKRVVGSKLVRGPAVTELVAGSGISLAQPAGMPSGTGRVVVSLTSGGGYEGLFNDIALRNAKQGMIGMFPYIRFPGIPSGETAVQSGISARFQVPVGLSPADSPTDFQVYVYVTMFGEQGIGVDDAILNAMFKMRYAVLRDYSGTPADYSGTFTDSLITPAADIDCSIPVGFDTPPDGYGGVTYKAFDPFVAHNDSNFTIEPGRALHALGDQFPDETSLKGGASGFLLGQVAARPGSFVGIELDRDTAALGQGGVYNGHIGITSIRWRLAPTP